MTDPIVVLRAIAWALMALAALVIVLGFLVWRRQGSSRVAFAASGISVIAVVLFIVSLMMQVR